jgi:hypothetical protein
MIGRLMKCQAGRAEHFVARIAALGVGLADGSVTVTAALRGILTTRITGRVLDPGNFYDRALHTLDS